MKKIYLIFISYFYTISVYATTKAPKVNCYWLPWCPDNIIETPWNPNIDNFNWIKYIWNIIAEWIKYIWIIAVLVLMISWIYFLVSIWEEEKAKKAKKMITWSLVWVIVANWAWAIINLLNKFSF